MSQGASSSNKNGQSLSQQSMDVLSAGYGGMMRYFDELGQSYEINMPTVDQETIDATRDHVINALHTTSIEATNLITNMILQGRDKMDYEIAQHYLERRKYGLEGSDGTFSSNYVRYVYNHHDLISLCCASKKNPFSRLRRLLVLINKISLALLLATLVNVYTTSKQRAEFSSRTFVSVSFAISLVLGAYGFILENIAKCYICNKANICVNPMRGCSIFVLLSMAAFSITLCVLSAIIFVKYPTDNTLIVQVVLSIVLDYLSFFYIGIINWLLVSWKGFLCCPLFPDCASCCDENKETSKDTNDLKGFPPRFLPILGLFPCRLFLGLFQLGERTYVEDKIDFVDRYPERVAIDKSKTQQQTV